MEGACPARRTLERCIWGAGDGRDGELAAGYSESLKAAKEWPEARSLAVDIDDRKVTSRQRPFG